jgi:hypothetical protein
MLWANNNFLNRLPLRYINNVTSSSFIDNNADFAVVSAMGHAFMNAGV